MHLKNGNSSYLEIDKAALRSNLNYIRGLLNKGEEFYSVVKGNAYGHGIPVLCPLLQDLGQNKFAVFSKYEAESLVNSLKKPAEVMIMGWIEEQDIPWAVEKDISFFVFDMGRLEASLKSAKHLGKKTKIHIELETGMYRTGFAEEELESVASFLTHNGAYLSVEGLCTHYAGAESFINYYRIKNQINRFHNYVKFFMGKGVKYKKLHTACSAATLNFPETRMDMVRIGILQYGFWPNKETYVRNFDPSSGQTDPLKRVISWKSSILGINHVPPGEYAGYGESFMTERPTKLAVVPIGYANGYTRSLSNRGRVLINGQRMSVVGTVNMNMILVDVTNLPHVKQGDEVVIIGRQGDNVISISSFGDMSNLLNYELLTRLPQGIPRFIV